jgi:hypothetical protein
LDRAGIVAAFGAPAWFQATTADAPSRAALVSLVVCARAELLDEGRRCRASSLRRSARLAARRRDWRLAVDAGALALRIAPRRAARWLARPGRFTETASTVRTA